MKMKSLTLFFFGILKIAVALVPDPKASYLQNIIKIEGKFKKDKNLMWRKKGSREALRNSFEVPKADFLGQSKCNQEPREDRKKEERKLVSSSYSDFCWMILFLQKFWRAKKTKKAQLIYSNAKSWLRSLKANLRHWIFG